MENDCTVAVMATRPPTVVDRYFKKHYKTDIQGKIGEDQLVLTHSNRVCVVCVAKSHPIFTEEKTVKSVSFEGQGWSRLDNTVTGKNKRGAQWLERSAPLCCVTCTDGTVYTLRCCVKGQLVETNLRLLDTPELLTQKPYCDGYLAVILPGLKGFDREIDHLKSEESYQAVVNARSANQIGEKTVNEAEPKSTTDATNPESVSGFLSSVPSQSSKSEVSAEENISEKVDDLSSNSHNSTCHLQKTEAAISAVV